MICIYHPSGRIEIHYASYVGVLGKDSMTGQQFPAFVGCPRIQSDIGCHALVSPLAVIADHESGEVLYNPYDNIGNLPKEEQKQLLDHATFGAWPRRAFMAMKWREN